MKLHIGEFESTEFLRFLKLLSYHVDCWRCCYRNGFKGCRVVGLRSGQLM